jgi:lactate permease
VLAKVAISQLRDIEIAVRTAALLAACAPFLSLTAVRLAEKGPLSRGDLLWTALAGSCFLLPAPAFAALIGLDLPTLGGALLVGAVFIALLRRG